MILEQSEVDPVEFTSPGYAGMILSVKELREVAKASPRYAGMILWDMLKQTWIQLLPAMRG